MAIIGSGAVGLALASLLGARDGVAVSIWGRSRRPGPRGVIASHRLGGALISRAPVLATAELEQAVLTAEVVILAVPTHARRDLLQALSPHLSRCVLLLSWEGTGRFAQEAAELAIDPSICAGLQRSPLIARRRSQPGAVTILGVRSSVVAGTLVPTERRRVAELLRALFPFSFNLAPSYEYVVLSPGNPLIHPARLFSWQQAAVTRRSERFYADWDDAASHTLLSLHRELKELRDHSGLLRRYLTTLADQTPVLSDAELTAQIRGETRLSHIKMPMRPADSGVGVDPTHRFVLEDIGQGLDQIAVVARQRGVPMPMTATILAWGRSLMTSGRPASVQAVAPC